MTSSETIIPSRVRLRLSPSDSFNNPALTG